MKKIGMLKAMRLCSQYRKLDPAGREALRDSRLREMVVWARENSPFYRESYRDLPENFTLADLPPVSKTQLMQRFDDWVTDPAVKLADVRMFMEDLDHIGRKYMGRYLVFTTSGSTGHPLVALCDETVNSVMGAVNAGRSMARKADLRSFMLRGGKTIGVFATGGFYLSNSSVRARLLQMPWKKRQMAVTSALLPAAQIVEQLNAFQPAMLGGYPSNLELLIDEQKSGRLRIHPVLIMTGGEFLSPDLRTRLSEAFDCYVQTAYACTEGGTIACECTEQRFHLNDDWVIVEPVDEHNRPVPDGTRSDKILLTNLFNFTQPYLRYEVTDRVVLHREPCACGSPSPWLTLEGRTDDTVRLMQDGREIAIPPLALYATLKEVQALRRFQLVSHPGNRMELRLIPAEGIPAQEAFSQAETALRAFLLTHGVKDCILSPADEAPQQHPGSGKFKHILCVASSEKEVQAL